MPKRIQRTPKQLELQFKGFKPKQKIQRLLGKTKRFRGFFKLGEKIIAEKRAGNFVSFHELDKTMQETSINEVAGGMLSFDPQLDRSTLPAATKLIKNKKLSIISYGLSKAFRNNEYLMKGIGTQILKSLEEMAREQGIEIILGNVGVKNIESQQALKKQGFKRLGSAKGKTKNYYYKVLG